MNYLAHLYLSDGTDESLLGSLLGDFVKGDDYTTYSAGIGQAILIHRRIDAYGNAHPIYRRSKARLDASFRHTKGILIDLFYDHFLARDWDSYADESLADFTRQVYVILNAHKQILPSRLQAILPRMTADDWLKSYREMANIERALEGLSIRLGRENRLHRGVEELLVNYAGLEVDFRDFFPQLVDHAVSLQAGLS